MMHEYKEELLKVAPSEDLVTRTLHGMHMRNEELERTGSHRTTTPAYLTSSRMKMDTRKRQILLAVLCVLLLLAVSIAYVSCSMSSASDANNIVDAYSKYIRGIDFLVVTTV